MKKVWVQTLFGRYKGLIINRNKNEVELVGYPFGSHPLGKRIFVPKERLFLRKVFEEK